MQTLNFQFPKMPAWIIKLERKLRRKLSFI